VSDDSLNGAGITAKERLGNIEELLKSMDSKLDNKADRADLIAVEGRVRAIELKMAFWAGAIVVLSAGVSVGVSFAVKAMTA
jgi:hypothetical protein